jgi:hypothetical protein
LPARIEELEKYLTNKKYLAAKKHGVIDVKADYDQ